MEPTPRIELGTSFLPRMRSTTELSGPRALGAEPANQCAVRSRCATSVRPCFRLFACSRVLPVAFEGWCGAGGRIRTCVAVRRRIYSPLELATLPPLQGSPWAWSPRGDSNPLTYRLQIGCAAIAPLGPTLTTTPSRVLRRRTGVSESKRHPEPRCTLPLIISRTIRRSTRKPASRHPDRN